MEYYLKAIEVQKAQLELFSKMSTLADGIVKKFDLWFVFVWNMSEIYFS